MYMQLDVVFMLGATYFMLYSTVFWMLLYFENKHILRHDPKPKSFPFISILIPAHNEERSIERAIKSCLGLTYPNKEVIVIANGCTDKTAELCKKYAEDGQITLIELKESGKALAMNAGLKVAKGELFCCLDADSSFRSDSLENMIGYFEDPKVGAVCSSVKVLDPKTIIQKVQWVEYMFATYLRKLGSMINVLYVVPGPGSMYRRDVISKIGGFNEKSLVEDMEIAFRLQDNGYTIKNSAKADVDTIAPLSLLDLIKQRIRWHAGFYDTAKQYKHMIFNPKYSHLGMWMIPSAIIWVLIVLTVFFKILYDSIALMAVPIKSLFVVGFDLQLFIEKLIESFWDYFRFTPSYVIVMSLMFTFMGIAVIYMGLKIAGEKVDLRNKFPFYAFYLIGYSLLLGLCWLSASTFILFRGKVNKWIKW